MITKTPFMESQKDGLRNEQKERKKKEILAKRVKIKNKKKK